LLLPLLLAITPHADAGSVPTLTPAAQNQASLIARMSDADPAARVNQLLAARDFDRDSLFALAMTHPGISEQLVSTEYRPAVNYISALPAPELHRIRQGKTILRTYDDLRNTELEKAIAYAETFGFRKFKPKKIQAMRVGVFENRVVRLEVVYQLKRKTEPETGTVELAWPSTPERDEASRNALSKEFGARPSRVVHGRGSLLPVVDASFEASKTVGGPWQVVDGIMLGTNRPIGEVVIDSDVAVDGYQSLRFYADTRTRLFPEVLQIVPLKEGIAVRARAQARTDNLRVEFQQREDSAYMSLQFMDAQGFPIGKPIRSIARLGTHGWELLEVQAVSPPGTAQARLGLISGLSGTMWVDAVTLEHQ